VIRRRRLDARDLLVTVLTPEGKYRAVARGADRLGGTTARLGLFGHVRVQLYRKPSQGTSTVVQVGVEASLARLAAPAIYPYAHLLAELADETTGEEEPTPREYELVAGGLRGLCVHSDPEAVTLAVTVKLLTAAGLALQVGACVTCGARSPLTHFDGSAGGLTCSNCARGIPLPAAAVETLRDLQRLTIRSALARPLAERGAVWAALRAHLEHHVGRLASLSAIA